jgi:hypothetical protein
VERAEAAIDTCCGWGPSAARRSGRLRARFPVEPDDENRFLSWDEVRALKASGIEIGSQP